MNTLPTEFINRIKEIFPSTYEKILETFAMKKPTTFRVNTLKSNSKELIDKLVKQGFEIEESGITGAFILKNKSQRELTETEEYKNGELYIQGLASMIPPIVLEPKENELILDICAAPGSKTTQVAALMKNTGKIIANDMSKIRLYKLAANIKTLGVENIQTTHFRAQDLWKKFPNTFDRVLVDVPCSLEGRFNTNYPKSYSQWSPKKIKILSEHQKHILRSAVACTKPGGTIVYSTCTISPEENEEVVKWILEKEKDISLEEITLKKISFSHGMTKVLDKTYPTEIEKTVRINPGEEIEAFFIAKFKKH